MTGHDLHTPIVLCTQGQMPWRDDLDAFYLLAGNGLYMCRNHPFFRSCAKARGFPRELEEARPFLEQRFPKIPQELMQQTVGFFSAVAEEHGGEAGLFLAWNRGTEAVELVVAPQTATISKGWNGRAHAVGLQYDVPTDLAPELLIFGDIHSHVHAAAYASGTDVHDETDKPGLHIVVGRITHEPPEVHAEIVVDGTRFPVDPREVIEGYERRSRDVPQEWLDKVQLEDVSKSWSNGLSSSWSGYASGSYGSNSYGSGSYRSDPYRSGSHRSDPYGRRTNDGGSYGTGYWPDRDGLRGSGYYPADDDPGGEDAP